MTVTPHDPSDVTTLRGLVGTEASAKQRDRYRAVLLAAEGDGGGAELGGGQIAERVGRSRRFVDRWLARYRAGGLGGLLPGKATGRPFELAAARHQAFKDRILAGPTAADNGVCALRGADARRILADEFGTEMTLGAAYALMHRVGLSCLRPRPRHRKNDPGAAAGWLGRAPLLHKR
jgi:transposase